MHEGSGARNKNLGYFVGFSIIVSSWLTFEMVYSASKSYCSKFYSHSGLTLIFTVVHGTVSKQPLFWGFVVVHQGQNLIAWYRQTLFKTIEHLPSSFLGLSQDLELVLNFFFLKKKETLSKVNIESGGKDQELYSNAINLEAVNVLARARISEKIS